jgi:succinyl-CoA synthetase beta subunit
MNIHEYQAKEIFRRYGIPVPDGRMCMRGDSVRDAVRQLGGDTWVVKAQVHAGGRGKGGGVRVVRSAEEAEKAADEILSRRLVTAQTGGEGREVRKVLVEQGVRIQKELYLSMLVDRASNAPTIICSEAGGMEIEQVAARTPEKIHRETIDPALGLRMYQTRRISEALGLKGPASKQAGTMLGSLYRLFQEKDASLLEINPLVVTDSGDLLALDAKLQFDDNALFRHEELVALRDIEEEDPLEAQAAESNLSYIRLDGNIGCMVNGAGLAMATMDLIQYVGGSPANFLDVGGGANAQSVEKAFRIILADRRVKAILINIFGGIVRCDRVAQGVSEAAGKVDLKVPVVVRLEGTNAEEARKILADSSIEFVVARNLREAAEKVVSALGAA